MPLCSSWIFRRGEKPFMCKNLELDDYIEWKKIKKPKKVTKIELEQTELAS